MTNWFWNIVDSLVGSSIPDNPEASRIMANGGRRGVYEGPPSACPRCNSLNLNISGGWEDGNVKTESVDCDDCGYHDSYAIA